MVFCKSAKKDSTLEHAASLAPPGSDTAWIGGIPHGFCQGDIGEVNKAFAESCKQFGEVVSATVRVKPGVNKSWALCTFKEPASARKCASMGVTLPDGDGNQVSMQCKISDIASNLQKGTTGALDTIAKTQWASVTGDEASQLFDAMLTNWASGANPNVLAIEAKLRRELHNLKVSGLITRAEEEDCGGRGRYDLGLDAGHPEQMKEHLVDFILDQMKVRDGSTVPAPIAISRTADMSCRARAPCADP